MSDRPSRVDPPHETVSDPLATHSPVCGSCATCGCPLGHGASSRNAVWFCCGGCANSGRCGCGCDPKRARAIATDDYIPTRRMFASRSPDELKGSHGPRARNRAFPFADRHRGR